MSTKKELSKRDLSIAAVIVAVVVVVLGGGFFAKQKAEASDEVARMQTQMKREMGKNLNIEGDGPVEVVEQQADPHFMP